MNSHMALRPASLLRWVLSLVAVIALLLLWGRAGANNNDPAPERWDRLLKSHVAWTANGTASVVDYAGFARDQEALKQYLADLSAVDKGQFDAWSKGERRAFLINAYNAFTIQLILTKYPDLTSIKDLGGLFSSPWKQRFFSLLGEQRSLDDIEQGLLRRAPDFDDPRIHFAINCASIGCPALRPEAYTSDRLEEQLQDQTRRFLSDTTRNRLDRASGTLTLSKVFSWYAADFEKGHLGAHSVQQFVAGYATALNANANDVARLQQGDYKIAYNDYDWSLNSAH